MIRISANSLKEALVKPEAPQYNQGMFKKITLCAFLLSSLAGLCACEELPESPNSPNPSASTVAASEGAKPADLDRFTTALAGNYARSWKLISRLEDDADMTQECYQDDQVIFYRDNRIAFDVGANPCLRNGQLDMDQKGSWQPTSEFNLLLFVNGESPFQAKILNLDDVKLIVSFLDLGGTHVIETYLKNEEIGGPQSQPAGSPVPVASSTPLILEP